MTDLEPNVDAYGSRARASALADFVELWAASGQDPSEAEVSDYIADNGWLTKLHELYTAPPAAVASIATDDDVGDDAADAGRRVFALIEERVDVLGGRYPFTLANRRLRFDGDRASPYLVPLAITIAHAYGIKVPERPEDVFEDTVTRVLHSAGARSVNFSATRALHSSFDPALIDAAAIVGLDATPTATSTPIFANDEKVDVIGHFDWRDRRTGAWTMVGQVTCGKSDEWTGKLQEVPVSGWMRLLGQLIPPLAFLAVPHHVDVRHLYYLVSSHTRLIVDRLRVALWLDAPTAPEAAIVDAVLACPVTPI